jgi:hypothetical protein
LNSAIGLVSMIVPARHGLDMVAAGGFGAAGVDFTRC